jgi:hypothetical protein
MHRGETRMIGHVSMSGGPRAARARSTVDFEVTTRYNTGTARLGDRRRLEGLGARLPHRE